MCVLQLTLQEYIIPSIRRTSVLWLQSHARNEVGWSRK